MTFQLPLKTRGFTLVEVLFAAATASMLFYIVYATFFSSVKQFSTNQSHLQAISITQTVLDIIESTVNRQIVDTSKTDSFLLPEGKLQEITLFASETSDKGIYMGVANTFSTKPSADGEFSYFIHNGKTHHNLTLSKLEFEVLEAESIANSKPLYFLEISITGTTPAKDGLPQRKEFERDLNALHVYAAFL